MMITQKKNTLGWFPIISAVLMLSFWSLFALFLPMQEEYLKWVMDDDWIWINIIGFIGSIFGAYALTAIVLAKTTKNTLDLIAYGIALAGIIILTCILFFEAFILKGIAFQNPDLINLNGSFYQYPAFKLANLFGGIFFTLGFLVLGIRMIQQETFKKWKIILLMIACPLFGIVIMPGNLRLLGVLLYSIAFMAIGIEMISNKTVANNK